MTAGLSMKSFVSLYSRPRPYTVGMWAAQKSAPTDLKGAPFTFKGWHVMSSVLHMACMTDHLELMNLKFTSLIADTFSQCKREAKWNGLRKTQGKD